MAETAVCSLIDKLIPLLTEEVRLLKGVHREVSEIKKELESIQVFLKHADQKAEVEGKINEGIKVWVEDIREAAFRIDDVVDEYIYHVRLRRPSQHRLIAFLNKVACFVTKVKSQHHIAAQIRDTKATVRSIKERSERYGFNSLQQAPTITTGKRHDPRKASLFLKESEVIGFESPKEELIKVLGSSSPERAVTSVVGMGGLGKTTLAKQVYDYIKGNFDCHALIVVSESYKIADLLRNLLNNFCGESAELIARNPIDTMDEVTLIAQLRKYLQNKRYLVFFDDVWNPEFWGGIEHALLDNGNGGRILMTTRNAVVANACKTSSFVHIHVLKRLPIDKAMELFCKKIFNLNVEVVAPPN